MRLSPSARSARARWHAHVNSVNPPAPLRSWLADAASLTARLTAACRQFRVQLVRQASGRGTAEECEMIGLPKRMRVWRREVILHCDDQAVVFARTIAPCAGKADWPWLRNLGERSLGAALFADPRVRRGELEFARLQAAHPLRRAMRAALGRDDDVQHIFYARRSKFGRRRSCLLVTEVFLPSILQLSKHESAF